MEESLTMQEGSTKFALLKAEAGPIFLDNVYPA